MFSKNKQKLVASKSYYGTSSPEYNHKSCNTLGKALAFKLSFSKTKRLSRSLDRQSVLNIITETQAPVQLS